MKRILTMMIFLLLTAVVLAAPYSNLRRSVDSTEPHPSLNGFSGDYYSYLGSLDIDYYQGWNLIAGFPSEVPDSVKVIYYYSPENNQYYQVYPNNEEYRENIQMSDSAIGANAAYWMYSEDFGSTDVFFDNYKSFQPLYAGWNFVGVGPAVPDEGMSLSDLDGTCTISKAYTFNKNVRRWQSITEIESDYIGEGILLKVPSDCYIEYPDRDFVEQPPALPDN